MRSLFSKVKKVNLYFGVKGGGHTAESCIKRSHFLFKKLQKCYKWPSRYFKWCTLRYFEIQPLLILWYQQSDIHKGFLGNQNTAIALNCMDKLMKFEGFQKCKIHSSIIKGIGIIACKRWYKSTLLEFVPRTQRRLKIFSLRRVQGTISRGGGFAPTLTSFNLKAL